MVQPISKLNVDTFKDFILSPGNVYWKKSSGSATLLSAKNGILNIDMIKKLSDAGNNIYMTDSINLEMIKDFEKVLDSYKNEPLLKNKILFKKRFIELLGTYFAQDKDKEQGELNHLCWKLFSKLTKDQALNFLNRDIEFFMRSQNIASSYVIFAFLLGYYDMDFLKMLFNNTMNQFIAISKEVSPYMFKNKMLELKEKSHLETQDLSFMKTIMNSNKLLEKSFIFERTDGEGVNKYSAYEMNDLETLFCNLCYHFNYEQTLSIPNILNQTLREEFVTNKRLLLSINSNFEELKNVK